MNTQKLVWLPVLGIRFVQFDPTIAYFTPWVIYQFLSIVLLSMSCARFALLWR